VPSIVVNISSHPDDYGQLLTGGVASWRWFAAPAAGCFAITHPEKAAECVSELHVSGTELYLAWHADQRDLAHPDRLGLKGRARHYVEYHHFVGSADRRHAFWQAGLLPIVQALIRDATAVKSEAMWQRLLEILEDSPGSALMAAENLLDLLQETLWDLERATSGRREIWRNASEIKAQRDVDLDRALKTLNCNDGARTAQNLSSATWTVLGELAKVSPPAEAQLAAALAAISALSECLFGDEQSDGLLETPIGPM